MEKCLVCGSKKKICKTCGAELHKRFDDFIMRAEVIYAIFMAWGFASSAEAVIRQKTWVSFPLMVISTFVLIRFFFAPTRNLHSAAMTTEHCHRWHWLVFVADFPLLVFHSFAFYTMCLALSLENGNAYRFFQWFVILLSANVIWLASIAFRMRIFGRDRHYLTFIKWCVNNFISVILFLITFKIYNGTFVSFAQLFFTKDLPLLIAPGTNFYRVLYGIALLNCLVDVILTASDYLGFDRK